MKHAAEKISGKLFAAIIYQIPLDFNHAVKKAVR